MDGIVLVISGPAGVGKTTICDRLIDDFGSILKRVITVTTRKPRSNEINGKDYFFVNKKDFELQKTQNCFIEYAKIHGNYYGSRKQSVAELLTQNFDVLLNIDVQGATFLKELEKTNDLFSKSLYRAFITPTSIDQLKTRLIQRGQDSDQEIQKRLLTAKKEMLLQNSFDYIIRSETRETDYQNIKDFYLKKSMIAKKLINS